MPPLGLSLSHILRERGRRSETPSLHPPSSGPGTWKLQGLPLNRPSIPPPRDCHPAGPQGTTQHLFTPKALQSPCLLALALDFTPSLPHLHACVQADKTQLKHLSEALNASPTWREDRVPPQLPLIELSLQTGQYPGHNKLPSTTAPSILPSAQGIASLPPALATLIKGRDRSPSPLHPKAGESAMSIYAK